ncbi:hypothetical protein M9H77_10208 [Catharanthus roseus]|uniref:Uncharacterized protein n=1 Tax=Catharanthus roseus TaxID=4058 RepID=A0ACC0C3D6_CATRO|nr:hypothetical protein M9H77_10208 [Catharanthus roseus]
MFRASTNLGFSWFFFLAESFEMEGELSDQMSKNKNKKKKEINNNNNNNGGEVEIMALPNNNSLGGGGGGGGLVRQGSITKNNASSCLCSPTNHAGSFRCRLHLRAPSSLQRTKSIEQSTTAIQQQEPHSQSSKPA